MIALGRVEFRRILLSIAQEHEDLWLRRIFLGNFQLCSNGHFFLPNVEMVQLEYRCSSAAPICTSSNYVGENEASCNHLIEPLGRSNPHAGLESGRANRSPDAAQRAAVAAWCAADPGSIVPLALLWVPALRSSVKNAAPRPRHERNLLSLPCGDLPVGRFVESCVQSLLQKYFCFHTPQITSRTFRIPPQKRGVS